MHVLIVFLCHELHVHNRKALVLHDGSREPQILMSSPFCIAPNAIRVAVQESCVDMSQLTRLVSKN